MAQISFSFSGGFWPISFPLFHGTARPSALGAVLVAAYMNGPLVVGEEPYVDAGSRALVDPNLPVAFSGRLAGIPCKLPFVETVNKIRIRPKQSLADGYRRREQNC